MAFRALTRVPTSASKVFNDAETVKMGRLCLFCNLWDTWKAPEFLWWFCFLICKMG